MPDRAALSGYAALAREYYDRDLHPTCASFREGSELLLERLLPAEVAAGGRPVEVGSGASLLAPWLERHGLPLDDALLTDDSAEMLEHSREWAECGAALEVAPASALPVRDGGARLLVASLADPYDEAALWAEIRRVLAPAAVAVVTTPSWAWASRFREGEGPHDRARFVLRSGEELYVPSYVRPPEQEVALIERHGPRLDAVAGVRLAELSTRAPKLGVLGPDDDVVVGYRVTGY